MKKKVTISLIVIIVVSGIFIFINHNKNKASENSEISKEKTPIKNEDALDVINTISERYISEKLEYYFKSLDYYNNIMKKTMWNMHKKQGIFHFMMYIFNKNHKKTAI